MDIEDLAPEDSIEKTTDDPLASGTDTGGNGQAWKEGDNKFQQAISAWRSRYSVKSSFRALD